MATLALPLTAFALIEIQLLLASIARRYRLQLESAAPVEPEILASLRPQSGVVMRLEPRSLTV